jgi:dihydrofolate reductase
MEHILSLIVCYDNKGGISKNGNTPWNIKEDLRFFTNITKRNYHRSLPNILIMGKNTWMICKDRVFKKENDKYKRKCIVVSKSINIDGYTDSTCRVDTLEEAILESIRAYNDKLIGHIFICGGSGIYNESINKINIKYPITTMYLTRINHDYACDNILEHDYTTLAGYNSFSTESLDVLDTKLGESVSISISKIYLGQTPAANLLYV